mgnify:CR=1 FL=1
MLKLDLQHFLLALKVYNLIFAAPIEHLTTDQKALSGKVFE